jgi:hypothetical protein
MKLVATDFRTRCWAIALPLMLSPLACTDAAPQKREEEARQGSVTQALANIQAPRTNIHTYTDQCFCKWGLVDATFPEIKLNDPRLEDITPRWGKRRYRWNNGQYEFEQTADMGDYAPADVDFPEKGVTGPIRSLDKIKCDRQSHVGGQYSCALGQKRMEFRDEATGVTWSFIFRRLESAIPKEPWGPQHKNFFHNIDVSAYKPTSAKDPQAGDVEQNAACWFDTINKGGTSQFKTEVDDDFTLPRPGGRYGESREEQDRYQATIAFWDHVTPNPPGSVEKDFNQDCTGCHGNGPVLDSRYYRQGGGRRHKDDDLPFHNIEFPTMDREFFEDAKVTNGGCGGDCHAYWAKNTETCAGGSIAESYVKVQTFPPVSKHRRGVKNWEFGNPNAEVTPADEETNALNTLLMPPLQNRPIVDPATSKCKDKDYKGKCVIDWIERYQEEYDNTAACCSGAPTCKTPIVKGRPPAYYPQQEAPPAREPYNEAVKAPSLSAAGVTVEIAGPCLDSTPACDVRISWLDPVDGNANRHRVPRAYSIDYLEKSPADAGETFADTDLDCRNKPTLVDPTSYESAAEVSPGENSYKKRFVVRVGSAIRCGKVFKARVCGARCSTPTAVEKGALSPELRRTCSDGGAGSGGSGGMVDASFDGCTSERCGSGGSAGVGGCSGTSCGSGGTNGTGGFAATGGTGVGGTAGLGGLGGTGVGGTAGRGGLGGTGGTGVGGTAGAGGTGAIGTLGFGGSFTGSVGSGGVNGGGSSGSVGSGSDGSSCQGVCVGADSGSDSGAHADASSTTADARAETLVTGPQSSPLHLNERAPSERSEATSVSSCAVHSGQIRKSSPWFIVPLAGAIAVGLRLRRRARLRSANSGSG